MEQAAWKCGFWGGGGGEWFKGGKDTNDWHIDVEAQKPNKF